MKTTNFSIKDKQVMENCLKWFLDNYTVTEENEVSLELKNLLLWLQSDIIYPLLETSINADADIDTQNPTYYRLLRQAIKEWLLLKNQAGKDNEILDNSLVFLDILNKIHETNNGQKRKYCVLVMLNIAKQDFSLKSINIRGINFEVVDPRKFQFNLEPVWEMINNEYDLKGVTDPYFFLKLEDRIAFNSSNATLLNVEINAGSGWDAIVETDDKLDTLRLALNFRSNLNLSSLSFNQA